MEAKSEMRKVFLNFQIPEELLKKIDDFRFEQRKSSRAEAVRELIEKGFKLVDKERQKKKGG
jgi:metal-responsive CopG/Arc/MetJ family transcriptional regulator